MNINSFFCTLHLRFLIWRHLRQVSKLLREARKKPPDEIAPMLTKWKWLVAHRYPEYLREVYLDALTNFEKAHREMWGAKLT